MANKSSEIEFHNDLFHSIKLHILEEDDNDDRHALNHALSLFMSSINYISDRKREEGFKEGYEQGVKDAVKSISEIIKDKQ